MSTEKFEQVLSSWLEEGPIDLPDWVVEEAMSDVERTRQARPLRRRLPWARSDRSWRLTWAAAAVVAAIAVVTALSQMGPRGSFGGPTDPTATPPVSPTEEPKPTAAPLAPLPAAGRIVAEIEHGGWTQWFHIDDEVMWLPAPERGVVDRIDPATTEVVATIDTGETNDPNALTVAADGSVWVTQNVGQAVVRIDPSTNQVVDTIETPDFQPYALALDGDRLWMSDYENNQVGYVDLTTRELTVIEIPGVTGPTGIAIAGGIVWVVLNDTSQLLRVDAESGEVLVRTLVGERGLHVAAGFDSVWTNLIRTGEVGRYGFDGSETGRLRLDGDWAYGLGVGPDAVWATSGPGQGCENEPEGSFVTRIDPATNQATHRLSLVCAHAVAATPSNAVWVLSDRGLHRLEPAP